MLSLAIESLETVPAAQRQIVGHTTSIAASDFDEAKKILNEALERVAELGRRGKKDKVFQFSFAAFPLTDNPESEDE